MVHFVPNPLLSCLAANLALIPQALHLLMSVSHRLLALIRNLLYFGIAEVQHGNYSVGPSLVLCRSKRRY